MFRADDDQSGTTRRVLFDKELFDDQIHLGGVPRLRHQAHVRLWGSFHQARCAVIRRLVRSGSTPKVLVDSVLLATALTATGVALLLCAQLP